MRWIEAQLSRCENPFVSERDGEHCNKSRRKDESMANKQVWRWLFQRRICRLRTCRRAVDRPWKEIS